MKRQRDVSVRDGTGPRSQEGYRGNGGDRGVRRVAGGRNGG